MSNTTTTTTEEALSNALDALSDSPIWKLLGRAEESALKNPPIFGRTWGNPDGHEGINRRLMRVRSISDRFSKRFIDRQMAKWFSPSPPKGGFFLCLF